jgi:FkbM family methyltransferase
MTNQHLMPTNPLWEPTSSPLYDYRSQHDQDRWVAERVFPHSRERYFIEMGAGDGLLLSNTYALEKELAWKGLLIEPSAKFAELKSNRTAHCANCCVGAKNGQTFFLEVPGPAYLAVDPNNTLRSMTVEADSAEEAVEKAKSMVPAYVREKLGGIDFELKKVDLRTLEGLLREHDAPQVIDFLSLDVEGHEFEVLRDFPFRDYTFLAMVIERPQIELRTLLDSEGYIPVSRNQVGDIYYIHQSLQEEYFRQ